MRDGGGIILISGFDSEASATHVYFQLSTFEIQNLRRIKHFKLIHFINDLAV